MSTSKRLKRRALCVGINEYANPDNNLNGCVNDAIDMAETLKVNGFPRTRVHLLTNELATKDNIMKKLEWLVRDARAGDVLIFYYSGHGSQITDVDGDEVEDQLDEIICPHDISFTNKIYITDDDLHAVFSKVPDGARVDVILDSCFSGTATRSITPVEEMESREADRGVAADPVNPTMRRQKYITPPPNHLFRINSMIPSRTARSVVGESVAMRDSKTQRNTLWSGCQAYQVSIEMMLGDSVRGAFTYNFTRILRRSNGNMSRQEIYSILRSTMANEGYEQIPALEAANAEALVQFPFRRHYEDELSETTT